MRFIHTADWHLGMVPDRGTGWSEARKDELWDSPRRLTEECNRRNVELMLIAGDVFHRPPLRKELKELDYIFSGLKHTQVVLIAGNHDYEGADSWYHQYQWSSKVLFLGGRKLSHVFFPEINTRIYGFSYDRRNIRDFLRIPANVPQRDGCNILMVHGGEPDYVPIEWENLKRAGFRYTALGHIHKPGKIAETIYYAGSPEPLDKTETGEHGFMFGETNAENKIVHIEFIPFAVRQYCTIRIEIEPEYAENAIADRVRHAIARNGERNIYSVVLTGYRGKDIRIQNGPLCRLGNIAEVRDETWPDYDFEQLYRENSRNMIGKYIKCVREARQPDLILDKALYYGMEALLAKKEK